MQNRRNTKAAKRLLIRLLKKQRLAPKRLITDKLGSYAAARRQIMPRIEYRSPNYLCHTILYGAQTTISSGVICESGDTRGPAWLKPGTLYSKLA